MSKAAYFLFVIALSHLVLIGTGITISAISAIVVISLLATIPLYFGTRNRSVAPTSTESLLATTWLWVRRLLALSVSALMFLAVGFMLFSEEMAKDPYRWLGAGIFFLIGVFLIYFAFYGQGMRRYELRDDIKLHEENKRRYRWRL